MVDYRYLAINTDSSTSSSNTYIVFVTKLQKRQILRNGFALFKNDITTIFYRYDTCHILQKSASDSDKKSRAISEPAFKERIKLTADIKSECPHPNSRLLPVRDHLH